MCKEQKTKSTSKSVSSIPSYLEDASKFAVQQATNLARTPFQEYTGDRTAGFTPDQLSGFQGVRDLYGLSGDLRDEAVGGARTYGYAPAQNISTERVVDESGRLGAISDYMNPYLEQVLTPALRQIQEESDAQRNRLQAMATGSKAFGDARHGILEGIQNRDTAIARGDVAGRIFNTGFDTAMGHRTADLNRFFQADQLNNQYNEQALRRRLEGTGQLLPRANQQMQNLQALLSTGGQQQALSQADLDAAYQEFLRGQSWDFDTLRALTGTLGSVPYTRTSTSEATQTSPDNSLLALAGGLAGSFLGGPIGGSLGSSLFGGGQSLVGPTVLDPNLPWLPAA